MNAIKIEIDKLFDGAETTREKHSKLNNTRKILNFPNSPRNKKIKSINLGNIDAHALQKNISKRNLLDKPNFENIKKINKQNSANNLNNNNNNGKNKQMKHLELKEKDINNFKDFKILKESKNEILFSNGILNNKIKSILFQNKNIKNNKNIIIKAKQSKINNFDNSNIELLKGGEAKKKDSTTLIDLKKKALIVKSEDIKRSSSSFKGKKINEQIKQINSKNKVLSSKIIEDEEKKIIKTPKKKLFIESNRIKQSFSQFIKIDKNILELNKSSKANFTKEKKMQIMPEENHFKAVFYSQQIKKFNKGLE